MLASFLIGLPAGARALTPLVVVCDAARRGALPDDGPLARGLASPGVEAVVALLAGGELWGDKLRSAPDRIVPAGIVARLITGGVAGASLAPRGRARLGAAIGASTAVAAAYLTFALRMRALRRFGQTPTGLVEDAAAVLVSQLAVEAA